VNEPRYYLTIERMLAEAIDRYVEYVERHNEDPERAKALAITETLEDASVDPSALGREAAEELGIDEPPSADDSRQEELPL
jgi:hypothetical protein